MQAILLFKRLMLLFKNDSFCSSGFKCSGPSRAIEKVIWAAIKKFADHWCKVTTTNIIQTQYGITLDVPCKVTSTNTDSIQLKYLHHINAYLKLAPMGKLKTGRLSEKPRYVKKSLLIQVAVLIVIRGFMKLSFHML